MPVLRRSLRGASRATLQRPGGGILSGRRRPWVLELYRSALGKKYVMAVTGMANETNRLANGYRVPIDPAFDR